MVENLDQLDTALIKQNNFKIGQPSIVKGGKFEPFGEDGISFFDFLDIINPLQHIPLVSTLYRTITGDKIDPASKLAGGVIFGGPISALTSLIDVMVKYSTGKDVGEHALEITNLDAKNRKARKPHEDPRLSINVVTNSSVTKVRMVGLGSGIRNTSGNNPFLATQEASQATLNVVLRKGINDQKMFNPPTESPGKIQNSGAARAYKEAFYLE